MHVIGVDRDEDAGMLTVRVESPSAPMGCRSCGVVAHSHGRREVVLVDAPCFDRPVKLVWRKRTWRCGEPSCPVGAFTERFRCSKVGTGGGSVANRDALRVELCQPRG